MTGGPSLWAVVAREKVIRFWVPGSHGSETCLLILVGGGGEQRLGMKKRGKGQVGM